MASVPQFRLVAQICRPSIQRRAAQPQHVIMGLRHGNLQFGAQFVQKIHTKDEATDSTASELHKINNQTLGAAAGSFPVVTLPNGDKLPTGTVGALLVNIKAYDKGNEQERQALEPAIRAAVPVLRKVGMFDLFPPEEWVEGGSPGRALVGTLALSEK
ncbi:hypothetical protein VHEMI03187 [[Torrubiella] hemipterigena]|uniref:DUF7709 domain-containing protein n=1 Tax=[Torrubiella] hemipterigena TaxID=1531966 RepID=A0A0A1TA74_9HYPO|nr:hypothetical protein VHEMI03187 [[Torrubiella] hemipterigena]